MDRCQRGGAPAEFLSRSEVRPLERLNAVARAAMRLGRGAFSPRRSRRRCPASLVRANVDEIEETAVLPAAQKMGSTRAYTQVDPVHGLKARVHTRRPTERWGTAL